MMRPDVRLALRRAMLVALAVPACGTVSEIVDGGKDAASEAANDATVTNDANDDAADAIDDTFTSLPEVGPPPDGCVITGKPDSSQPCYTELLNDGVLCGVDVDADLQDDYNICYVLCSPTIGTCYWYALGDAGGGTFTCGFCNPGRMHDAAQGDSARCHDRPEIAEYLARAAYLEAVSIDAFRILESELARHGAPRALRASARRAAHDEVRHAQIMSSLASRRGATVRRTRRTEGRRRSLLALAIENAVEGCVRETFSAALAMWQAREARDPNVRAAMESIATDEIRHAELAWRIATWTDQQLSSAERAVVHAARARATSGLESSLETQVAPSARAPLGLPDASQTRALFESLRASLLS